MKAIKILIPLLSISTFFFSGCIGISHISESSGVEEKSLRNIPQKAKTIIVEKANVSADEIYEEVIGILMSRGHRIMREDKQRYYITTEGKDVGQSTLQRMVLTINKLEDYAQLKIITEWKGGTDASIMASSMSGIPVISDWAIASWEINRAGIAFSESYAIAKQIRVGNIRFE